MNKKLIFTLLTIIYILPLKADEGMWLPMFIERLNYVDMQNEGLNLTPEEIYSVNNASMKDAIVAMGGGFCTGEIISNEGLFLTNHHCGFGSIQSLSSNENNMLEDGFFAKSKEEEIPVPGLFVNILSRMEDVTESVLKGTSNSDTEDERKKIIAKNIAALKKEQGSSDNVKVSIKSFYYGSEYYMFIYDVYSDIRFVAAPPRSIGKFGGDTDNWMWPRHTGDFSFFRIYASPENEGAEYAENNIPFTPKYFFPVSMEGTPEDSFSMILGYPGSTDRYLTSFGIQNELEIKQPAIVKIRTLKLDIYREEMDSDPTIKLQYASKYARTANYWKYYIGQQEQLKRNKVKEKKEFEESEFTKWLSEDISRSERYGEALVDVSTAEDQLKEYILPKTYFSEAIYSTDINKLFYKLYPLNMLLTKQHEDKSTLTEEEALILTQQIEVKKEAISSWLDDYYKDYNLHTAQRVYSALLNLYYTDLPSEYQPEALVDAYKKSKGDLLAFTESSMTKSSFGSEEKVRAFLASPDYKTFEKDPMYQIFEEAYLSYKGAKNPEASSQFKRGMRLYVEGLRLMKPDKQFYPNANSTLRMTYGEVKSYEPQDGAYFYHFTTLKGIMDKEDPTEQEFIVPEKLKELYGEEDYGNYADKDGSMHVCFLSDNDITGGNSGSPVINGKGHLIGLAFDGNWEAMSGDIAFETNVQRTISVDIRYVLFIIDKLGNAPNIIEELKLVYPKTDVEESKETESASVEENQAIKKEAEAIPTM